GLERTPTTPTSNEGSTERSAVERITGNSAPRGRLRNPARNAAPWRTGNLQSSRTGQGSDCCRASSRPPPPSWATRGWYPSSSRRPARPSRMPGSSSPTSKRRIPSYPRQVQAEPHCPAHHHHDRRIEIPPHQGEGSGCGDAQPRGPVEVASLD